MSSQILIVGGAGFIGRWVTKRLLACGHRVVVAGRRAAVELESGVRYCQVRNSDYRELAPFGPFRAIVDLAYTSLPQTSYEDPVKDIQENLPRFVNLLQFAVQQDCERFIFLSSGGTVYGQALRLPIDELHPLNPISPYGITKLATEKYAAMFFAHYGLKYICLRPGNVYGPGQLPFRGQGFIATAVGAALTGNELVLFGKSGGVRDYIHVDDTASAVVAAIQHGVCGEVYNVGSGNGLNNLDVLASIKQVLPPQYSLAPVRHLPERIFDVRANVLDSTKFIKQTGWYPQISFQVGIEEYIPWVTTALANHTCGPLGAGVEATLRL